MDSFCEKFILNYSRDEDLSISRTAVMEWIASVKKLTLFEERRKPVAERLAKYESSVEERLDLLARIQQTGGLRSQRFDIVPENFEAALYLDLMRMLDSGAIALRCSGCGMPIPYDHSGRANKQRARSKKGEPIYHLDCFAERCSSAEESLLAAPFQFTEIPRGGKAARPRISQDIVMTRNKEKGLLCGTCSRPVWNRQTP